MKKTFTVNISGTVFHIDDDAYEKLYRYLDNLKTHFSGTEGSEEIIADIEMRIAELLRSRLVDGKQVITLQDVNHVMEVMGQPYEFDESAEEKPKKAHERQTIKRLYRDPDNKVIGGVCGGIGAYFGADPIWFRLAFLLSIFFFASGIIIYLILWIVVPEAQTTAEKLEMRGENVNISNIEKSIKEEIDELKKKLKDLKDDAKGAYEKSKQKIRQTSTERFFDFLITIIKYFAKALAIFIGIIFIIVGIFLIIGFISSFFYSGSQIFITSTESNHFFVPLFLKVFFETPSDITLIIIGLALLICIPLVMLIFNGIKLIFGIKSKTRAVGIFALSLWLTGVAICGFVAVKTWQSLSHKAVKTSRHVIAQPGSGALIIDVKKDDAVAQYMQTHDSFSPGKWNLIFDEGTAMFFGLPKIDFVKSENDSFQMTIYGFSHGKSRTVALHHASAIEYNFADTDTSLILSPYFKIYEKDKWRNQRVKIIIKVPVGKSIYLTKETSKIMFEDEFYEDFTFNMPGKEWIMTENGLRHKQQ